MPNYLYTDVKTSINQRLHSKITMVSDIRAAINDCVSEVVSEVDLRSMKRKATLAPNLFSEVFQYSAPTDLKGQKIIDIQPQVERRRDLQWQLTTDEEFDRMKEDLNDLVAVSDKDFVRKLLISILIDDETLIPSPLDSTTSGLSSGLWSGFGDGTNLTTDNDNFIKGSGSVNWDINAAAGTTAGIQATTVNNFDITDYRADGSAFVWVYFPSVTNISNVKLRLGNDSSNYIEMTATTTNEGTAFVIGWNLVRFTMSGGTVTGTLTNNACDYIVIYLTKTAAVVSLTDFRFDHIFIKLGKIHNVIYYSEFPWQSSAGTYKIKATADTDYLNCSTDEYNLIVEKGVDIIGRMIREEKDASDARDKYYNVMKPNYELNNPSEALLITTTYHEFDTIKFGDDNSFNS